MSSTSATLPSILPALKDAKDGRRTERNIVMCLDGTGDQFDGDNSNVVKFFAALKKDDPSQLTYYQTGVGTYSDSYKGALKSGFNAAVDMAIGASLGQHVREAYSFLMQNYRETDKICLIGFSRGAYTARALAGMLHKVGLLPAHNQAQIAFAYSWYKDNTPNGWAMSADFKQTFSIDVDVYFLGCWDTVASVGFIPRILPFAKTNNKAVRYFRHALALDERRAKFKANHWRQRYAKNEREEQQQRQESAYDADGNFLERALEAQHRRAIKLLQHENERNNIRESPSKTTSAATASKRTSLLSIFLSHSASDTSSTTASMPPPPALSPASSLKPPEKETRRGMSKAEEEFLNMKKFNQTDAKEFGNHFDTDVLEVWFLGCHADCGGGAVANGTRHMVSRIPLRWMIRQTFACETGILFKTDVLAEHGLDLHLLWPTFNPPPAPQFGPSPSTLDVFANAKLPELEDRRNSVRLHLDSLPNGVKAQHGEEAKVNWPALWHQLTSEWQTSGVLSERDEDYFDCLAEINDQLVQAKGWWILELWPIKYRVKDGEGKWKKQTGPNMGRYRTIRTPTPNIHWTVLQRQELTEYSIRCTLEDGASLNVVY